MFVPDNIYKDIIKYAVIPTVDIIFINKNKEILLGLRNNAPLKGAYYLPGGRIQKGETITDAAKRKSKEEINIEIDVSELQFVGVYDDIFSDSAFESVSTHCLPCTFVYQLNDRDYSIIKTDNQHSDIKFFSYDDFSLHPFLQKRLEKIQSEYNIF